jgi:Ca2+-binding EF-hand superfamily protein
MQQIDEFGKNLSHIFIQYDDDCSGTLSRDEVVELLNDLCDQMRLTHLEQDQVTQLQEFMGGDQSNEITLTVLTTNWHHVSRIMKQKFRSKSLATCRKVFLMFKKGNNERLGRDQIKAMCNYLAEQIPTRKPSFEEINDILEILDDNGDGEISFNEFLGNIDAVNKFIESLAIKSKTADAGLNKDGSNPAKKSKSSVNML